MEELVTPTPIPTITPTPTPTLEEVVGELTEIVESMELTQSDMMECLYTLNDKMYLLTGIIIFAFVWLIAYLFYRFFRLFF